MRTETEIREALVLCQACNPKDNIGIQNRDLAIETLRYALGIDDDISSPMEYSFSKLIQDMRDNPAKHGIASIESFSA